MLKMRRSDLAIQYLLPHATEDERPFTSLRRLHPGYTQADHLVGRWTLVAYELSSASLMMSKRTYPTY